MKKHIIAILFLLISGVFSNTYAQLSERSVVQHSYPENSYDGTYYSSDVARGANRGTIYKRNYESDGSQTASHYYSPNTYGPVSPNLFGSTANPAYNDSHKSSISKRTDRNTRSLRFGEYHSHVYQPFSSMNGSGDGRKRIIIPDDPNVDPNSPIGSPLVLAIFAAIAAFFRSRKHKEE